MNRGSPRIGLFGGSFDPPHLGHLALARAALAQLRLDELRWLPAGQPWQKLAQRAPLPGAQRAAMLALLIEGEAGMQLDARELNRQGPSYSVDTVLELAAELPGAELWLIIGQDQAERLGSWHRWRELLARVNLAIVARNGQEVRLAADVQPWAPRLQRLEMPALPISSTLVRAAAARDEDLTPMVGEKVAGYIAQHRLYSEY